MNFEVYLFDFDGTVVDSYDSCVEVFKGAYASVGVELPEGYTKRLMRCQLGVGYKELNAPEEKIDIFHQKIIELLDDEEISSLTKTYDDVIDTLKTLKERGKMLGIVTSNNIKHVKMVFRIVGIDEKLFDVYVGNKEVKRHKPFPDPILKAIEDLKCDKNICCYVGDALDDVRSSVSAGVTPILLDRYNEYENVDCIKIHTLKELV